MSDDGCSMCSTTDVKLTKVTGMGVPPEECHLCQFCYATIMGSRTMAHPTVKGREWYVVADVAAIANQLLKEFKKEMEDVRKAMVVARDASLRSSYDASRRRGDFPG